MKTLRYTPIPAEFYRNTRDRLAVLLPKQSLVVIHSNDVFPTNADGTMAHRQNADLFYLTGIDQEETVLLMQVGENGEHKDTLLLRETNERIVVWEGARLTQEEAAQISGIEDVRWTAQYAPLLAECMSHARRVYLELDEHPRRYTPVQTRNDRFASALRASYPEMPTESLFPLLAGLRLAKSAEEIAQVREACRTTGQGFAAILPQIRPGMGEWEMEGMLSAEYIRRRSRGFSFLPIIAAGADTCVLHYISNHKTCRDGELVLFDVGAEYGGYAGDMSRTVPVNGKYTPRQRAVYDAVLAVHRYAAQIMLPGVNKMDYERRIRRFMAEKLVELGLLSRAQVDADPVDPACVRQYYMHGTSHSLGIDVHDVTPANPVFAPGQIWTIEPGIYIPEEGIGVRIETDVLIRPDGGVDDLIPDAPLEAAEVEAMMQH